MHFLGRRYTLIWTRTQARLSLAPRHIRVASKQALKDRIMAAMDHINQYPVVHTCEWL
jgi:hypothetical protein